MGPVPHSSSDVHQTSARKRFCVSFRSAVTEAGRKRAWRSACGPCSGGLVLVIVGLAGGVVPAPGLSPRNGGGEGWPASLWAAQMHPSDWPGRCRDPRPSRRREATRPRAVAARGRPEPAPAPASGEWALSAGPRPGCWPRKRRSRRSATGPPRVRAAGRGAPPVGAGAAAACLCSDHWGSQSQTL